MELVKIKGPQLLYSGATNVGVYRFKNGFCAIVDSGIDNTAGKRVIGDIGSRKFKGEIRYKYPCTP